MDNEEERKIAALKARDEQAIKESKNLHIIKRLAKYMAGYWPYVFAAWGLCVLEVTCEVLVPFFSQYLVAAIEADAGVDVSALWFWAIIMLVMAVASTACGIIAGFMAAKASAGFARNLRQAMYYKVQEYSFANIDKFSASSLVTRMTTDVTNVQFSVQMIMRMVIRAPLMMIAALVLATVTAWPHWQIPVTFLCIIPFLAIVLFGIAAIVHPTFVRIFNAYDGLNASVQENLEGIRVVKSYGREDFEGEKFGKISYFIYRNFVKAETLLAFNSPAMQIAIYTATCCISYFCGKMIIDSNGTDFSIEQITPLLSYIMMILNSLMMLSMVFVMVTMSRNSAERIVQVVIEEPSLKSPENPIMEVPNGEVVFEHVNFRYFKDSQKNALDDININIPSGSTVGIIGATGSSKTTLISLIARLYDVSEGSVKVGGHDVREYDLKVLRDSVAVVLQKNVLFSGTIRSNLLWGNENATDEEIKHAAHLACADEFIDRFPDGYDSKIEQGGTNVSGGQKQRLCIARALLKKPKILILDDSTSAVDTATDAKIRRAFKEEIPDTTEFIVAQRLLSIKDCDQILILDDGKIIAHGTNDELMKTSPVYQELYETQMSGGDFDAAE
ncbi:MAG: ABC transporter ATP-binding protein [Bacillota bacterium]|nr:ABC transporter ATP-binding protein [Bacillota bacterium]